MAVLQHEILRTFNDGPYYMQPVFLWPLIIAVTIISLVLIIAFACIRKTRNEAQNACECPLPRERGLAHWLCALFSPGSNLCPFSSFSFLSFQLHSTLQRSISACRLLTMLELLLDIWTSQGWKTRKL